MMMNNGTRVAMVNFVFSTSRNTALIERKMVQYTTISIKLHHFTLSEQTPHVFTISNVFDFLSKFCTGQKQHSKQYFLTKSDSITLQTGVKHSI